MIATYKHAAKGCIDIFSDRDLGVIIKTLYSMSEKTMLHPVCRPSSDYSDLLKFYFDQK